VNKRLAMFLIAILVQCAVLAAVPGKQVYTRITGKVITIQTRPYDPYDVMSGYYVTLAYDIGWMPADANNWETAQRWDGKTIYVILKEGRDGVWVKDGTSLRWPSSVPAGGLVVKGTAQYRNVFFGIEKFYIPETKRKEIEEALRRARSKANVRIAVDRFGNAAILSLEAGGKRYEY
jgi:uncharacterized membrane-anchored protein